MTRPAVRHRDPRASPWPTRCGTHLPHGEDRTQRAGAAAGRHAVGQSVDHAFLRAVADDRHLEVARALQLTSLVAVPLSPRTPGWSRPDRRGRRVHRGRRRGRRAAGAAGVPRRRQGAAVRARRPHLAHAAGQPAAADAARGAGLADGGAVPRGDVRGGGRRRLLRRRRGARRAGGAGRRDVVGHDITAAATMGQLTSVYRALLVDRPAPSAMIDRLQASWSLLGLQRMATALFATLDPATGQLRIASAGHLPPLLLTAGHAEFLPVSPSRMLGAPPAPAPAWSGPACSPVGGDAGAVHRRAGGEPVGRYRHGARAPARGGSRSGDVGPRRALRPAAARADRRAPRRRHRTPGTDVRRP